MFEFSKRVKETIFLFHSMGSASMCLLSMFEFRKRVKETIFLMSFDEFSKHWFTVFFLCLSLESGLRRLIFVMSFDEFSKHWLTIVSMLEFSKRVTGIFFDVIR